MGRFDQLRPKDLWARGMEILPEPTPAPDAPGDTAAEDPAGPPSRDRCS